MSRKTKRENSLRKWKIKEKERERKIIGNQSKIIYKKKTHYTIFFLSTFNINIFFIICTQSFNITKLSIIQHS